LLDAFSLEGVNRSNSVFDVRKDDPNDTIKHQDRRELRAVKVFGAWVNHFDTKMHNSLDMYVGIPGQGYVKHHFIDFASTLGAYGADPVKRFGYEFGIDLPTMLGRFLTLGMIEDRWVYLERPEGLSEVGLLDVETFEPDKWEPDIPHSGMADMTADDGYWAAKILSAFSEDQIRAMVVEGNYQNSRAVDYLVKTLVGRQQKIVNYWFEKVPPLDFFQVTDEGLRYTDLAVARGFFTGDGTRYRTRLAAVTAERETELWSPWLESFATEVSLGAAPVTDSAHPFQAIECQVNRGQGWSSSTFAFIASGSGRLVAVDR